MIIYEKDNSNSPPGGVNSTFVNEWTQTSSPFATEVEGFEEGVLDLPSYIFVGDFIGLRKVNDSKTWLAAGSHSSNTQWFAIAIKEAGLNTGNFSNYSGSSYNSHVNHNHRAVKIELYITTNNILP